MKSKLKMLSVLAVAAMGIGLLSQQAHANLIVGSINMGSPGSVTLNPGLTAVTSVNGTVTVGGATGDYAVTGPPNIFVYGDTVTTFNPFSWPIPSVANPVIPLWSFTDSNTGYTYSFDLLTDSMSEYSLGSASYLDVNGTGMAYIKNGATDVYTPTEATFLFTVSNPDGPIVGGDTPFSFNAETTAVPDGGLTVSLLGFAMLGLEGLRRKLSK
jgi:hypothetical protein